MSGESNFNLLLCGSLTECGATYQRLEDKLTSGIPDYNVCHDGVEFWIEAKFCTKPARPSTPLRVSFREFQLAWMRERIKNGGICFVMLRCGRDTFLLGKESIISGYIDLPMKRMKAVTLAWGKTHYVVQEAINLAHYLKPESEHGERV